MFGLIFNTESSGERADVQLGPVCVEAVDITIDRQPRPGDPSLEAAARSAVEEALSQAVRHPPRVDAGCPSPPLPTHTGGQWRAGLPVGGEILADVDQPSGYEAFVFVVGSLADIDRLLGGTTNRVAPQEFISTGLFSDGPTSVQVASAVYVTREEIEGAGAFLSGLMLQAAGFGRQ